jgi:hypothetical protein
LPAAGPLEPPHDVNADAANTPTNRKNLFIILLVRVQRRRPSADYRTLHLSAIVSAIEGRSLLSWTRVS